MLYLTSTLSGTKHHTRVQNFILRCKIHTQVKPCLPNFIPGYQTSYLGTKLHTQVKPCIPGYQTLFLGTKLHTWVPNFISVYLTSYLGTKLYIVVPNVIPGYVTSYLGTKLQTWVPNFLSGYKNLMPELIKWATDLCHYHQDIETGAGDATDAGPNLVAFIQRLKQLAPSMHVSQPVFGYPQVELGFRWIQCYKQSRGAGSRSVNHREKMTCN
jgi:hypothetical protein